MFKVGARERGTYCLEYRCCTLDAPSSPLSPRPVEEFCFSLIAACLLSEPYDLSLSLSLSLFLSHMKSHYCIVVGFKGLEIILATVRCDSERDH